MNKYSFDGDSSFILKAAQDCVINGVSYKKEQPVAYFEHCKPMLYYNKSNKNNTVGVNKLLHFSEYAPDTLIINDISKQESLSNLIFNKKYDTIYTEERVEDGTVDENGRIYLKCSDEAVIKNLFVYDENGAIVNFQLIGNILIGSSTMSGKTFKIFYTTEINKQPVNQFKCFSAKVPYLCGQIITKGKINGIDGKMIVNFPKLVCSTAPILNFSGDEMFDSRFELVCVDTEANPIEINYIYG